MFTRIIGVGGRWIEENHTISIPRTPQPDSRADNTQRPCTPEPMELCRLASKTLTDSAFKEISRVSSKLK
jgi:hypothetical protein